MTSEEELELIRQASMDAHLGKNIEQYFTKAQNLFASDVAYDILCDINGLLNQINTLKKRHDEELKFIDECAIYGLKHHEIKQYFNDIRFQQISETGRTVVARVRGFASHIRILREEAGHI